MLDRLFAGFVLVAILCALGTSLFGGAENALPAVTEAAFTMAETGFELALKLAGIMTLWLGLMRIGERAGAVAFLAKGLAPLLRRLFPGIPEGHPARGSIVMNMAANVLGLDNAATPMGLQAMKHLEELNPEPGTATDDQVLFLVLNTSSVTLIPISVLAVRAAEGAADPTDVFVPILVATSASTLGGLLAFALTRRRSLLRDPVMLGFVLGLGGLVAAGAAWLSGLDRETLGSASRLIASASILGVIGSFVGLALWRGLAVFELFVEGAKEGFTTAIRIVPYLVGMLVAIGMLRASGALGFVMDGVRALVTALGGDTRFVEALPVALMKPFSGGGARALMVETMNTHGADSFAGVLSCVFQGSTETTFYVLAVYFGAVGIKRARGAVGLGLFADLCGAVAAITVTYLLFG